MSDLMTVEERIKTEYGVVKAWIALHVYSSVFLSFVAGAICMWIKTKL